VIDRATDTVGTTLPVAGKEPFGVAVTPDGSKAYVANFRSDDVSVIVISTISVGSGPAGVSN
jgi:YVTN family beta-propeller protein